MSRLNYEDILTIYRYISLNHSATQIASKLNIARSTLYRLIKNNREIKTKPQTYSNYPYLDCTRIIECKKALKRCPANCPNFKKNYCPKLKKFPFICDFCEIKTICRKERFFFNPDSVYLKRRERLVTARKGISLSKKELSTFDEWLSPLIKKNLSIEALYSQYKEVFPVSTSTVRRWINQGYLRAKRIDLLRAVRFKAKKEYHFRVRRNTDPLAKYGHTYQYFLNYLEAKPKASVIEMDTVYGLQSESTKLLTFFHRKSHLQFGILIPNLFPSSVSIALNRLQHQLGTYFSLLFEVILADNGLEFDDLIKAVIKPLTGEVLSQVFYTRPYNSGDKGGCERNHELFRYLVPKGRGLTDFIQKDINFMFSMINSYPRESLNWKTPIDVFKQYFPKEILSLLSIEKIPLNQLNLKKIK